MLIPEALLEFPLSVSEPSPVIVPLFVRLPVIRPALAISDSFLTTPVRLPSAVFVRVPESTVILSAVTAPSFPKSPLNDTLLWAIVFPAALLPPLMLMIPVPLIVPLFTRLPVIRPALAIAESFLTAPSRVPSAVFVRVPASTVISSAVTAPLFSKLPLNDTLLWAIVFPAALLPLTDIIPSPLIVPLFTRLPVIKPALAIAESFLTAPSRLPSAVFVRVPASTVILSAVTAPSFPKSPLNDTLLWAIVFPAALLPLTDIIPVPLIVPLFTRLPVIRPALAIADSFFILSAVTLPAALTVSVPTSTVTSVASTAPLLSKSPLNDTLLWAIVFPAALLPPLMLIIPVPVIVPLFSRFPVISPALAIAESFLTAPSRLPSTVFVRVPASTVILSAVTAPLFSKSPLNDTLLWAIVFPAALLPPLIDITPVPVMSFALSPPLKFSVPLFTIPSAIDNAEALLVSSLLIVSTFCVMLPLLTTLLLLIVTAPVPVISEEIVPPIRLRSPSLAISVTMRLSAFETTVAEAISTLSCSMICVPTVRTSVAISGVRPVITVRPVPNISPSRSWAPVTFTLYVFML